MENKYYEFNDYYYALIRADDKESAIDAYIQFVCGDEENRDEIRNSVTKMSEIHAIAKFLTAPAEDIEEFGLPSNEEYLKGPNPLILLIDGSLL